MSHVTGVVALIAAMVRAAGTLIVMPRLQGGASSSRSPSASA